MPDTPGDQLIDTDGDGVPDTLAAVVAEQVAAAARAGRAAGGRVRPADADRGRRHGEGRRDRRRRRRRRHPDAARPRCAAGRAGASRPRCTGERRADGAASSCGRPRFGRYEPAGALGVRQTVSVESTAQRSRRGVAVRRRRRSASTTSSASPGRGSTRSRSSSRRPPTATPVDMEVVLEPATGAVSGVVVGPGGPLGNVDLVLTDGTLTFNTSTASAPATRRRSLHRRQHARDVHADGQPARLRHRGPPGHARAGRAAHRRRASA